MINYILQVVLFQVLFLAIYDFFISKETFFTKNRWYLVSTPILSFLIPLIKIPTFQKAVSQEYIVYLPEIVLSPEKVIKRTFETTTFYESINYFNIIFWIGVVVFSILFLIKLMKIINLIRINKAEKISIFRLIFIPNKTNAFSFFNYIFLGKEIPVSQQEKIIQHEMVHSKQKHSLDLLLFEFLKIAMWFNPMIYLYQKRITLVHEYISDEIVSKKEAKEVYINNLLSNYFQVENVAFVNQFYKTSLIKKRIVMMTKKQSKKINQLKYLLLIPVLTSMLFYSSCSSNKNQIEKRTITFYRMADGELFSYKGDVETSVDSYFGPDPKGLLEEIPYEELPEEIKKEQYVKFNAFRKKHKSDITFLDLFQFTKFFKTPEGRIVCGTVGNTFTSIHPDKIGDELLFIRLDKRPTFPGCEEGDSDCFIKKLEQHFFEKFDKTVLNNLELETNKVKVLVDFNINTNGFVEDIKVNAPNEIIGLEAKKVIAALPKMTGGEKYGKPIKANYKLPFTILID
ncbi:M56 family metallopeptidase [Polaribacter sp. Hel_I_88]|uniref:M56 family metallopeptidase n=1 Tax=Polaribacter sp. Hel_I_88 TaxID=1250006 RepID=UPI00047A3C38|nr:M56 family metallopeptidase [Polaribacter sp. Hel_I_88]